MFNEERIERKCALFAEAFNFAHYKIFDELDKTDMAQDDKNDVGVEVRQAAMTFALDEVIQDQMELQQQATMEAIQEQQRRMPANIMDQPDGRLRYS